MTKGSEASIDAGNVNVTVIKGTHFASFYSGKKPQTSILVAELPAPAAR